MLRGLSLELVKSIKCTIFDIQYHVNYIASLECLVKIEGKVAAVPIASIIINTASSRTMLEI